IGGNPSALAFLATPWIWVTALAIHLYQREAERRNDVPAGLGTRSRPVAGYAPPSWRRGTTRTISRRRSTDAVVQRRPRQPNGQSFYRPNSNRRILWAAVAIARRSEKSKGRQRGSGGIATARRCESGGTSARKAESSAIADR